MKGHVLALLGAVLGGVAAPVSAQVARGDQQVDVGLGGVAERMDVAADGGRAIGVWVEANARVWGVASADGGVSWSPPVLVDRDPGAATKTMIRQATVDSVALHKNHAYVTWRDDRIGSTELFFNRSIDGGFTYGGVDFRLDNGYPPGVAPVVDWAMDVLEDPGGNPMLDKIFILITSTDPAGVETLSMTRSLDGGATFLPAMAVPTVGPPVDVDAINLHAEGDFVHIVWQDDRCAPGLGFDDVFYRRAVEGGSIFTGAEMQLNTSAPFCQSDVEDALDIHSSSPFVYAAWQEERLSATNEEVRFAASMNDGGVFAPDIFVGGYLPALDDVNRVRVAGVGPLVYLTWTDDRTGTREVYSTTSLAGGAAGTWALDTQVSLAGGRRPRIDFGRGKSGRDLLVLTWEEGTGGTDDAYAAWSEDGGISYKGTVDFDSTTGDSDGPRVALSLELENVVGGFVDDVTGANQAYTGGFSICGPATSTLRDDGAGNPSSYTVLNPPVLGGVFTAAVDVGSMGHSFAILDIRPGPLTLPLASGKTLQIDVTLPSVFSSGLVAGPVATISAAVPNDPTLCCLPLYSQAVHLVGPPFCLSDAQDLIVGAY